MKSTLARIKLWTLAALAVAGSLPAQAQATNPAGPADFSNFKIISDRNVFDPNRRPRMVSGPAPTIVDSFSLAGTMSCGKGLFAVFDGSSPDYHKVLAPGSGIAGYIVKEIRQEGVKLSSGTNELELSVGMQMRRNEDGRWSVGEPLESSGGSAASSSRPRNSGRHRSNSESPRAGAQSTPQSGAPAADQPPPDQASGAPGAADTATPPPETSDDPVVQRMLERRNAESGTPSGN